MGIAQRLEALAARQEWIDSVADQLQLAVRGAFSAGGPPGQSIANLLHGTWLGHPLHPAVIGVPIGSWTFAVALDLAQLLGAPGKVGEAADTALGFGILGAVAAAATGLTDWKETDGRGRRAAFVHALLNTAALLLFAKSLLLRRTGDRQAGQVASSLGYGLALTSAALGGDLVYGLRIGVNHAVDEDLPSAYVAVLPERDLPERVLRRVDVGTVPVLLMRQGDQIYAIGETCSHLGGPLSEGRIEDASMICPWHGSRFALATGRVLDGPATFAEPCFEARVREGQIEVRSIAG